MGLPDYLSPSGHLLRAAFPNGLPERDWPALFRAIYWDFSNRNMTMVLDDFLGTSDGSYVLLRRFREHPPDPSSVDAIKRRLEAVGWEFDEDGGPPLT